MSLTTTKINPYSALDILTIDFLLDSTKCCSDKTENESVVTSPQACSKKLTKRLTEAMLSSRYLVFRHQAFTCKGFLWVWFNLLWREIAEKKTPLWMVLWWSWIPTFSLHEYLIPILQILKYFKITGTRREKFKVPPALKIANDANYSPHVHGCHLDIGAKTVFIEHNRLMAPQSKKFLCSCFLLQTDTKYTLWFCLLWCMPMCSDWRYYRLYLFCDVKRSRCKSS